MRPKQVQPILIRVELGVMAMKKYTAFPKALGLEPYYQMQFRFIPRRLIEGVLPLCSDAVGVFKSPSWKDG